MKLQIISKGVLIMSNLILLPIICICVVILIVTVLVAKKNEKKKYDERQLVARNAAFKTAFLVLAGYCFLCACLNLLDIRWAASEIQMLIGVIISITAFACICINKDAYFGFNDKHPIIFIVLIYLLSIVTTVCVFCFIYKGEPLISNGQVSIFVINLVTPICCALVGTIALVRYFRRMKNGDLE